MLGRFCNFFHSTERHLNFMDNETIPKVEKKMKEVLLARSSTETLEKFDNKKLQSVINLVRQILALPEEEAVEKSAVVTAEKAAKEAARADAGEMAEEEEWSATEVAGAAREAAADAKAEAAVAATAAKTAAAAVRAAMRELANAKRELETAQSSQKGAAEEEALKSALKAAEVKLQVAKEAAESAKVLAKQKKNERETGMMAEGLMNKLQYETLTDGARRWVKGHNPPPRAPTGFSLDRLDQLEKTNGGKKTRKRKGIIRGKKSRKSRKGRKGRKGKKSRKNKRRTKRR